MKFGALSEIQYNGKLDMTIPNDPCGKVTMHAVDVKYNSDDDYYWYGETVPDDINDSCNCYPGYLLIQKRQNELFGSIQLEERNYIIHSLKKDIVALVEQANSTTTYCGTENNSFSNEENVIAQSRSGSHCNVRILVLYTELAMLRLPNPENTAQHIINISNQVLLNSRVNSSDIKFKLAGVELLEHFDETDLGSVGTLNSLRMDSVVHGIRQARGADIVLLIVDGQRGAFGSIRGRSSGGSALQPADRAFCVVASLAAHSTTPIHEIGHLFGCQHEPCNASNSGLGCVSILNGEGQAHTFEYKKKSGCWPFIRNKEIEGYTVMHGTYRGDHLLFSNPEVVIDGVARGIVGERNNAADMRNGGCGAANFVNDNNPNYEVSISLSANEPCAGEGLDLSPNFTGGCPGVSTWKWYYSGDGVTYQHLNGYDNEGLDWTFPNLGVRDYIRCNATSPCGESVEEFITIRAECNQADPYDRISNNDRNSTIIKAFPNPTDEQSIKLSITLNKSSDVAYDLIGFNGDIITKKCVGNLPSGTHLIDINTVNQKVIYLRVFEDREVHTVKLLQYD